MTPKRKKVEEYLYKYFAKIDPTGKNVEHYKKVFASWDDKQFDYWMQCLKEKKAILNFYTPNQVVTPKIDQLVATAKELGIKIFHRLKLWDAPTQTYYVTQHEYMVLTLPLRRMSQFVDHKLSVPEGDSRIDLLSGQVVKPDQAGSLSQIETQTLYARGLTKTITELVKYRGGDVTAFAEYKRELEEQGKTTVARETGTIARSAVVVDVMYSGLQLESNASGV